jgi:Transglycosylase SLT domain
MCGQATAQVAPVSALNAPVARVAPRPPVTEAAIARPGAAIETPADAVAGSGSANPRGRRPGGAVAPRWALLGRGLGSGDWALTASLLFGPASPVELDRIAFAVDGAESSHGSDPRMWRPVPSGPQGPMQVSLAAAIDVGGGDRFDPWQNRLLGRAYLSLLFQRYGNWPDAVAAYNWGPGNLESWIAAGRPDARLPFGVEHYVGRVLRDAAFGPLGGPGRALALALGRHAVPIPEIMPADYRLWLSPGTLDAPATVAPGLRRWTE